MLSVNDSQEVLKMVADINKTQLLLLVLKAQENIKTNTQNIIIT